MQKFSGKFLPRAWDPKSSQSCNSNLCLINARLFQNIEGSIIAKCGQDEQIDSQAAVLANICHEFSEFGCQAFNENKMQAIFIQHDQALYVAKPIFSLILCFVCDSDANLGLIRSKVSH